MKRRTALVPLLVSLMLLWVISTACAESIADETWTHFPLGVQGYGGLKIEIETPCKVDPGDNINVTVRAIAPSADLEINYIGVDITGLKNETDEVLIKRIWHLNNSIIKHNYSLKLDHNVTIPSDTSPGLIYGVVSCQWTFNSAPHHIPAAGFIVTYVTNRELDQLHAKYEELNATYHSLLGNFTELDSGYAVELNGAKNLMYVFVVTTVVAGATVLVLIMRRPRTYW